MDYISLHAQPTAILTLDNATQTSFDAHWVITNFESGYNYQLYLLNTSTMLIEEVVDISNSTDTYNFYDLQSGTTYGVILNASYTSMIGTPTTSPIAIQYIETMPIPLLLNTSNPGQMALGWLTIILFPIMFGYMCWSLFMKWRNNEKYKEKRRKKRQQEALERELEKTLDNDLPLYKD